MCLWGTFLIQATAYMFEDQRILTAPLSSCLPLAKEISLLSVKVFIYKSTLSLHSTGPLGLATMTRKFLKNALYYGESSINVVSCPLEGKRFAVNCGGKIWEENYRTSYGWSKGFFFCWSRLWLTAVALLFLFSSLQIIQIKLISFSQNQANTRC